MDKFQIPKSLPTSSLDSLTKSGPSALTAEKLPLDTNVPPILFLVKNKLIENIKTPEQLNSETKKLINKKNSIQDQLDIVKSIFNK